MEKKEGNTSQSTSGATEKNSPDAKTAIFTGCLQDNEALKAKYNEMHTQGPSAWFSDGKEERETIIKSGEPWKGLKAIEIGCGEGDLLNELAKKDARTIGVDYSYRAIETCKRKYPRLSVFCMDYDKLDCRCDRIVMQGVLEHLDEPFRELEWMIDNLLLPGGDIITSSPCFVNPRGVIWMVLDSLGAVMSKTDLHFLHPWDFERFCQNKRCELEEISCDFAWGAGEAMHQDLKQRIPLALKDGNLKYDLNKSESLKRWISIATSYMQVRERYLMNYPLEERPYGATMVYRIKT